MKILEKYEEADAAFRNGNIFSQDNEKLLEHLYGLQNQNNINAGTQHRDIIRGITLNHILMQRHIDDLNRQNARTQRWVIILAIAALIGTTIQTIGTCVQTYIAAKQCASTAEVPANAPSQKNPKIDSESTAHAKP